jgi:hypothetical protein
VNALNLNKTPTVANVHVLVKDYWGREVLSQALQKDVAAGETETMEFDFGFLDAPQYRISVKSLSVNGTLLENIQHRHYSAHSNVFRTGTKVGEEGWEVALSKDEVIELPRDDAKWEKDTPFKENGAFFWRDNSWTQYEDYAQHWYSREIEASANPEGTRTLLRVSGNMGLMAVFVNGEKAAEENRFGFSTSVFDITDFIDGERNSLILRFRNNNIYGRDKNDPKNGDLYPKALRVEKSMNGIFGKIYIERVPDVAVDYMLIDPSWRKKQLDLRVFLTNHSGQDAQVEIDACVLSPEANELLRFKSEKTRVGSSAKEIRMSAKWADPVLWSLDDPNLLKLLVTVKSDSGTDSYYQRFGFREWYSDGVKFLLNGKQPMIFDTIGTDPRTLKDQRATTGLNAIRQPYYSYEGKDICDEEGFASRMVYFNHRWSNLDSFLKAQRELTLEQMKELYNSPSIFMFAVENELGGQGRFRDPKLKNFYMDLITEMQSIDPIRPTTSDGDLDVFGSANAWSVHYPHETIGEEPNCAFFVKKGVELMDWFPHPPFDGKKPVFFTEVFSGGLGGPDRFAPIYGNKSYTPLGVFDAWSTWTIQRMRAYRMQDVALFEPFEPFVALRNFFPLDIFLKSYSRTGVSQY